MLSAENCQFGTDRSQFTGPLENSGVTSLFQLGALRANFSGVHNFVQLRIFVRRSGGEDLVHFQVLVRHGIVKKL
jgi:hypothetical protein